MIQRKMLLGIAIGAISSHLLFAQVRPEAPATEQSSKNSIVAPIENLSPEDIEKSKDDVLAYRFYLEIPIASCDLVVSNPTDKPAFFTLRGMSPQTEGVPAPEHRVSVGPGESVRVPASEAKWGSFSWVLVDAPRRAHLSLCSGEGGNDSAISVDADSHARVFDVFTENRPPAFSGANSRQRLTLLTSGSKSVSSLSLEVGRDLAAGSRQLLGKEKLNSNMNRRVFVAFDVN